MHTITNILERHGIPRNNIYKNITLDRKYFKNIDSYDKAYFLGFLITDGNVIGNSVRLMLKADDDKILKVFKEKTHNSNPLYYTKRNEVSVGAKCAEWVSDLSAYGVIPRKTATVYMPILSDELMPHLIRGLIDGDGSISYKSHYVFFCGNEQTVTQLRDFLVKTINVKKAKILHTQPHLWCCQWASHKDILKICNYIYKDKKDCFLQRKYDNFLKIQGNTEVND